MKMTVPRAIGFGLCVGLLIGIALAFAVASVWPAQSASYPETFPHRLGDSTVTVYCDYGNIVYVAEVQAWGFAGAGRWVPRLTVVPGGCR
jgi:hypothetical protein